MRFEEPSGAWVETQFGFLGQGARRLVLSWTLEISAMGRSL
jgi:hypothetical protein